MKHRAVVFIALLVLILSIAAPAGAAENCPEILGYRPCLL